MSTTVDVTLDTLEGSSATHRAVEGWDMNLSAIVQFPDSYTATSGAKLFVDSLAAVIAVVGDRGSTNAAIPVPNYLDNFVPELLGARTVKVKINYKGYPLYQFEVSGSLSQVETNVDKEGDPIITGYTYPDDYQLDPTKAGKTYKQGGLTCRPTPEPTFITKFIVAGDGVLSLMTQLALKLGKVNGSPYTVGSIVGASRTWQVTVAHGVSKDGGSSYEASFGIQYRAATWDPTECFINPDDGKPPPDLDSGASPPGYYRPKIPFETTFPIFLPTEN